MLCCSALMLCCCSLAAVDGCPAVLACDRSYGRNYLIPNRLAVYATDENQLRLNVGIGAWRPTDTSSAAVSAEQEASVQAASALEARKYADEYKKKLSQLHVNIVQQAGEKSPDALQTPITAKTLYRELTKFHGFIRLTLNNIYLPQPITTVIVQHILGFDTAS